MSETKTRSFGPVDIRDYDNGTASAYQTEYVNGKGHQFLLCELEQHNGNGGTYTRVLEGLTLAPVGRVRQDSWNRFEVVSESEDIFYLRGTFDTTELAILAVLRSN